ncbi:hypothetical protein [Gracilimonas mengyeensis]|uniref:hypothetical protein n=1 Tax=Gracilimonas mengyeensis TaxID=1302730 RepID=UPI001159FDE5|nr:hypothetical protein [Gracilimonas mengyeensis]
MSRFKNYISVLFFALAITGTMLSMVHYHSAGLECLDHADEQHYIHNEVLCPVSGIVAVSGQESQPVFADLLPFPETVYIHSPLYLSAQPFVQLLGRAPPA